jgi:hypothetical protein
MTASSKPPLAARLRGAMLRPAGPEPSTTEPPVPLEALEAEARSATDKERLIGLLLAPWAALIGILISAQLVHHDPAARLASGLANPRHVNVSFYHEVLIAMLVLAVAMLVSAWFRKRLFLGVTMALFGLTVFNLHYWGFAVPYLLCAGWLLVRGYRLQRSVREASVATVTEGATATPTARPRRANKRYTPPAASSAR